MRTGKKLAAAALFVLALVLTGCGGEKTPGMDTVSIQKDGSIRQTIVGQFEKHYYDVDELSSMAREKAERYSEGAQEIVCESVEDQDGKIVIQMVYQSGEDYTRFNNREFFCGTVAEACAQGYSFDGMVTKDGSGIAKEEITSAGDNQVVIVQTKPGEELDVNVYRRILYVSGDITRSGKTDAVISGSEETKISYIIF